MRWKSLFALVVLMVATAGSSVAQTRIITGRVTEAGTNQPIVSAQVTIRGSAVVTFTREDGTYTIGVPDGAQELLFRVIGFRRAAVTVGANQSTVDVALERDVLNLEEIVVTRQATRGTPPADVTPIPIPTAPA